MNKLRHWLRDYFNPEEFNDLDVTGISEAMNDSSIRSIWLSNVIEEMRQINISVDKRLLSGNDVGLIDLCARRKAYQDILESALSARRQVVGTQEVRHNPKVQAVNLDRVTA